MWRAEFFGAGVGVAPAFNPEHARPPNLGVAGDARTARLGKVLILVGGLRGERRRDAGAGGFCRARAAVTGTAKTKTSQNIDAGLPPQSPMRAPPWLIMIARGLDN